MNTQSEQQESYNIQTMSEPLRVLFVCTGNSARSQMAEGLLRHFGGGRYEVHSAGTNPTSLRPEAVEVMREAGIDISGQKSKSLEEYIGQDFDYVITVCSKAKESCPVFPGDTDHIAWDFDDPAEVQGSEEKRMHEFRRVRDEIHQRLSLFMSADHR